MCFRYIDSILETDILCFAFVAMEVLSHESTGVGYAVHHFQLLHLVSPASCTLRIEEQDHRLNAAVLRTVRLDLQWVACAPASPQRHR
jgi:hypothetical protein